MRRVVCVALVTGCWGNTAPPAPVTLANAAPAPTAATTRSNVERWVGTGTQFDDGSSWEMVLTIRPGAAIGDDLGTISYPGLSCAGRVIREPDEGDVLIGRERITEDPEHRCVDGGVMVIPRARGATFQWKWRFPDGKDGAEADLSRQ